MRRIRLLSSLRGRIIAAMVLVTCFTAMLTGGALAVQTRTWVYQDAQQMVFNEFRHDMHMYFTPGPVLELPDLPPEYTASRDGVIVRQGETRVEEISPALRRRLEQASDLYLFERLPNNRVAVGYAARSGYPGDPSHLTVYTIRTLDGISERLGQLARIIAVSVIGCSILGGLLGFALIRSIVRPLRRIQRAARRVADGEAVGPLPRTEITELRDVTITFNDMVERQHETIRSLVEQDQRGRRFVSDVAHELRSPLAALVPAAEVLGEEMADNTGDAGRAARLISTEIHHLARLVEDLLEMSRNDSGGATVMAERIDLIDLVARTLRLRGWAAKVTVVAPPDGRCAVISDPRRVEAIVANLVGNALRHGMPPVSVLLGCDPAGAWIEVRDHGPGIPPEHAHRVFERMYKVSDARTRTGGAGLGLAIAKENAHLLRGDLIYRRAGEITIFRMSLPTAA